MGNIAHVRNDKSFSPTDYPSTLIITNNYINRIFLQLCTSETRNSSTISSRMYYNFSALNSCEILESNENGTFSVQLRLAKLSLKVKLKMLFSSERRFRFLSIDHAWLIIHQVQPKEITTLTVFGYLISVSPLLLCFSFN